MSDKVKQGDLLAELKARIEALEKENVALRADVLKSAAVADEQKVHVLPTKVVEIGDDKYRFNLLSFRLTNSDVVYYADEVQYDADLLSAIVGIEGQQVLALVVE